MPSSQHQSYVSAPGASSSTSYGDSSLFGLQQSVLQLHSKLDQLNMQQGSSAVMLQQTLSQLQQQQHSFPQQPFGQTYLSPYGLKQPPGSLKTLSNVPGMSRAEEAVGAVQALASDFEQLLAAQQKQIAQPAANADQVASLNATIAKLQERNETLQVSDTIRRSELY